LDTVQTGGPGWSNRVQLCLYAVGESKHKNTQNAGKAPNSGGLIANNNFVSLHSEREREREREREVTGSL
jgi:hypothetical protein